jgi:hypothetical protein
MCLTTEVLSLLWLLGIFHGAEESIDIVDCYNLVIDNKSLK